MLKRLFVVLTILFLGSVIWWPGLHEASSFNALSVQHVTDSADKLSFAPTFISECIQNAESAASHLFNSLFGREIFPQGEFDAEHEAPTQGFFSRMLDTPYFANMRAMLELACVRAILSLAWFAVLSPLMLTVVFDAWVVRRLKYETFAVHHPTLYQTALSAPALLLSCAFTVMLMPWFIPPSVAALFYFGFLASLHLLFSQFHRFG